MSRNTEFEECDYCVESGDLANVDPPRGVSGTICRSCWEAAGKAAGWLYGPIEPKGTRTLAWVFLEENEQIGEHFLIDFSHNPHWQEFQNRIEEKWRSVSPPTLEWYREQAAHYTEQVRKMEEAERVVREEIS